MKIALFICLIQGLLLCVTASTSAQVEQTIFGAPDFAQYGCFASNDAPQVRQVSNTANPPVPFATFTGGRRVGGLSNCFVTNGVGMGSYATSHTTPSGAVIPGLGNEVTVSFHRPVEFRRITIEGKWPQHVTVTVDGSSTEVDLENYQGTGTGFVTVGDPRRALVNKRFSTIQVSSSDPDWRFGIYSITYVPTGEVGGQQPPRNSCTSASLQRPSPEDHNSVNTKGWSMHSEISDSEGLVLTNVKLNGRLLAERISVPYYLIQTSAMPLTRGELRPDDPQGSAVRSRLVYYNGLWNNDVYIVRATYAIQPDPSSNSCLTINQDYEFWGPYGSCEPSDHTPCQRFRAYVTYDFTGGTNDLFSVTVVQRNHYNVNSENKNSIGLFQDCDAPPFGCVLSAGIVFANKKNPLYDEYYSEVVTDGQTINAGITYMKPGKA